MSVVEGKTHPGPEMSVSEGKARPGPMNKEDITPEPKMGERPHRAQQDTRIPPPGQRQQPSPQVQEAPPKISVMTKEGAARIQSAADRDPKSATARSGWKQEAQSRAATHVDPEKPEGMTFGTQ